ncbi:MAG: hypothetical protein DRR42_10185 [Gammaproteobacteria bacterium]|nr:MAG: hypothetical protein DRR42_10185 [Gammaproteobacteria bacterium]
MSLYLKVYSRNERYAFKVARLLKKLKLFYTLYEKSLDGDESLSKFKDRHKGERCFIMGGGPSLKAINPEFLKREVTFGVNGIFLIYDWLGFEPTYYCVEDCLVYEDRWRDITKKIKSSTCFFPVQFSSEEFDRVNHNYFKAIYEFDPRAGFPRFSEDISKLVWIGGTVTYVCIQLALYMGFEEVYLLGMDHNYAKPDHVESDGDIWLSQGNDPNHFHPDYFGSGYRWHDPKVWRMEEAYCKARQVFERRGKKIINATVGGNLEVFDRVNYAELFR